MRETNYKFRVVEHFISINGEGTKAGQLSAFVRLQGCNLNCSYCDTKWANEANALFTSMTAKEIAEWVVTSGVENVTLTGGEPLLHKNVRMLLEELVERNLFVEIETNGSVSLEDFIHISDKITFTMDYKLPSSHMEHTMCLSNFSLLEEKDTIKFVVGTMKDLQRAKDVIDQYKLTKKCHIYLSPVFNRIEPKTIVEFMINHHMNGVNLQLQLHKFIWEPNKKGV